MASIAPFGSLLRGALKTARELKNPLLLGALFFSLIITICTLYAGDPATAQTMTDSEQLRFTVLTLLSFILIFVAQIYFFIVVVEHRDPSSALSSIPAVFFPLLGVMFWVVLRSFVWVMSLGMILVQVHPLLAIPASLLIIAGTVAAIMLGPRLSLAPLLYLRDRKGILQSADDAMRITKGYWGKIVGNTLLMILIIGLLATTLTFSLIAAAGLLAIAVQSSQMLLLWIAVLVQFSMFFFFMLLQALYILFLAQLTEAMREAGK